jgi:hypothetical protein
MYLSPMSEIRVETEGHDVSYALPARPLGKFRWLGLCLVAFGMFFASMPVGTLAQSLKNLARGNADPGNLLFALFMIPFVLGGLIPFCVGVLIICGRSRVEWRNKRLSVVEYAGPIRWRQRLPRTAIRKFKVSFGGTKVNDRPVTSGPFAELASLVAEFEHGQPRMVVMGYPRDWLQALAQDLSGRVGASAASLNAPTVEVVDAKEDQPQFRDQLEKPAGSKVRITTGVNGPVIEIPPAGLWKGSKGLLAFGIFWCLFMVVFTGFFLFTNQKDSQGVPGGVWLFIAAFWLIGLGLLAGAVNMGRRRATLRVEKSGLRVTQTNLFGIKSREWRREAIAALRADASGMAVNDVPILELQIHPVTGKKAGFFAGRADDELRWLATELRRALNVPAQRG